MGTYTIARYSVRSAQLQWSVNNYIAVITIYVLGMDEGTTNGGRFQDVKENKNILPASLV